jgi:hypothetical protein
MQSLVIKLIPFGAPASFGITLTIAPRLNGLSIGARNPRHGLAKD